MKRNIKYVFCGITAFFATTTGCKKSDFNLPPQDQITVGSFYKTADQVQASTNGLYNSPWFDFIFKGDWAISELSGGNGKAYSSDVVNFGDFSVTNTNTVLNDSWRSLFTVVAQSDAEITNLQANVDPSVDKAVVNNALGEARLMRAVAYFYLVRIWGNVPIIDNTLDYVNNYQINTNPVPDVYKFIVNDLLFAEANCTKMIRSGATQAQGHVSSGSASALLAKVYLYMQDYTDARAEAEKVINSGEFKLYGIDVPGKTYNDLFKTANNNNEESVIALQWQGGASYGHGNPVQSSLAANSTITGTGDGYAVMGPNIDLQTSFESGDQRFHATIMKAGDFYPEIDQASGGYTVPLNIDVADTRAAIKKYVVGTPADNGGLGGTQSAGNNTYIMRYADVLLIEAEAVLGTNASTSDPAALNPFNEVRKRAGLGSLPSITEMDILHERRDEFAIESNYWYDLGRLDGFNVTSHPKARAIIDNQERGIYSDDTPPVIYSDKISISDSQFLFPYPATETALNPKLTQPPVPYNFK